MPDLRDVSVVVLASGAGTRLGELTRQTPKPLLAFGGKPYLEYLLDWLIAQGIGDIVITVHTHAQQMYDFLADRPQYAGRVRMVTEKTLVSTVASARTGLKQVTNRQSFIMTGDTIWDVDIADVYTRHVRNNAKATAMVFGIPKPDLKHVIPLVTTLPGDDRVVDMNTAPSETQDGKRQLDHTATSGFYVVDVAAMLQALKPEDSSLERESMNRLVPGVYIYRNEGLLLDYGSPANYERLRQHPELLEQYYPVPEIVAG